MNFIGIEKTVLHALGSNPRGAGERDSRCFRFFLKKRAEPGGIASLLFAVGREIQILPEQLLALPLSQLYQFLHCSMVFAGCNTAWTHKTAGDLAREREIIERLKSLKRV